ncbi:uncharacterized protein LOC134675238 [Cydia fagiglandana]|uniref:uncharacterized protein LOC134675238 n=1 Tax=Cydia fagiglandana TaxID=1458189 RepID=UPI002FEE43DA
MMSFEEMFIVLFLYFIGVCDCQGPVDADFVLNFDSPVYVCPDPSSQAYVDTSAVEVDRYNETTSYMTGTIYFHKGFDSATMVEIMVEREINGQYEMFISHEICDVCKEFGDEDSLYAKYFSYFGFPTTCPFAAGPYEVHDLKADNDDLPINGATAGRYQVTINLYNNPDSTCKNVKEFIACLKLDFIIEQL